MVESSAVRASVEAKIREAFSGIVLGNGLSLRQVEVIDRYGDVTEQAFAALPQGEITDDWSRVPFAELERDCVAHLDPEGLRYYLPALMLSLMDHYEATSMRVIGTISALDPRTDLGPSRYALLSHGQKSAIADFLAALPSLVDLDYEDATVVARAWRAYWRDFATVSVHGA